MIGKWYAGNIHTRREYENTIPLENGTYGMVFGAHSKLVSCSTSLRVPFSRSPALFYTHTPMQKACCVYNKIQII